MTGNEICGTPLEPAAAEVCRANAKPPLIFQLPPECGRALLNKAQDAPVFQYPANITSSTADTGVWGKIPVYIVTPVGKPARQTILYIHGAGWVFGNFHTHEKLVRELAARTESAVVFPEYSLSPEVKYPTALEQCYSVLCGISGLLQASSVAVASRKLSVAGDSVGGNLAAALTILAKQRSGPVIDRQLLYYPVTNACFDTGSYREFACGYYLYRAGMRWFWDQYTCSEAERREITASPLRASVCQLSGLPKAMVINGEADVLRDEGQAYAKKLRQAGVDVTALCLSGTIHDFVMLHALDQTNACRAAMDVSTAWLNDGV